MISVYFTQIQFFEFIDENHEDLSIFIFRAPGRQHSGNTCARTTSSTDRACIPYTTSVNRTHPHRYSNATPATGTTGCTRKVRKNHEYPNTEKLSMQAIALHSRR